jgi:hypothetical protein
MLEKIKILYSSEVEPGVLGRFRGNSAEVAGFGDVLDMLNPRARKVHEPLANAVTSYIANHENEEHTDAMYAGRSLSLDEEAPADVRALNSPGGWAGYILHGLRSIYGTERAKRFTSYVSDLAPVKSVYNYFLEHKQGYIDSIMKLTGLKPFDDDELEIGYSAKGPKAERNSGSWMTRLGQGIAGLFINNAIDRYAPAVGEFTGYRPLMEAV